MRKILGLSAALALAASSVEAQGARAYAGGTAAWLTQTHSALEPLGGTTWDASLLVGVWMSSHVALEFEPILGRTFSSPYSYRAAPDLVANVVASRRDSYFPVQVRFRLGSVEPVFGGGYLHATEARHATLSSGQLYFDDERSDDSVAVTLGLDVPLSVSRHVAVLPGIRLLAPIRGTGVKSDPIQRDTNTGGVALRYGVGARVDF